MALFFSSLLSSSARFVFLAGNEGLTRLIDLNQSSSSFHISISKVQADPLLLILPFLPCQDIMSSSCPASPYLACLPKYDVPKVVWEQAALVQD